MPKTSPASDEIVSWLHRGDQQRVARRGPHFADLRAVAQHGAAEQYALAREALAAWPGRLYAAPGDHERRPRDFGGRPRLFLDMVPRGSGGPDFRVSPAGETGGRVGLGSDAGALGAWPERHIPGGRLGPNRNGRTW